MLLNEILILMDGVSGPIPHMTIFFTFACILGLWTREIKSTLILMIIWSVAAECLQAYYPSLFSFELGDIGSNLIGSVLGIIFAQVGLFVSNTDLFVRVSGMGEVREKETLNGNYSRQA
jgi:hypothetical protein